jgi:ABC-type dipeptide/oligopeptide/nickel transport system permease subunit
MMLLILGGAIFAPWISSYDPYYQDFAAALEPPSLQHLFGTDSLGRDIFTRVLYGGRRSGDRCARHRGRG